MTEASTRQAVSKFTGLLPKLPLINGTRYSNIDQVYALEDKFELNDFMAQAVQLLNRKDGQLLKNTCYPTIVLSFQRYTP